MSSVYRMIFFFIVFVFYSYKGRSFAPGDPPVKYVEQTRLERSGQVIALTLSYVRVGGTSDHYTPSLSYFVHIDKKTGKSDTAESNLDNVEECNGGCIIRDMTDSFQLGMFVVQVVTPLEAAYYFNTYLAYQGGQLKELFQLMDTGEKGVRLHRKGTKLIGLISGRDEVVENFEDDYPVEVDTKTFDVKNIQPDKQAIHWKTTVTQLFRAYRVVGGQVDTSLVTVKPGTRVTVDSIYRTQGKVRVRVQDSVKVEIKVQTAKEKLRHNGAG